MKMKISINTSSGGLLTKGIKETLKSLFPNSKLLISAYKNTPNFYHEIDLFVYEIDSIDFEFISRELESVSRYNENSKFLFIIYKYLNMIKNLVDIKNKAILSVKSPLNEVESAIENLLEGKPYYANDLLPYIFENYQFQNDSRLTERELKIVELISKENSDKEISNVLCLSLKSVEKLKSSIRKKLMVKSSVGIVIYGLNKGLL